MVGILIKFEVNTKTYLFNLFVVKLWVEVMGLSVKGNYIASMGMKWCGHYFISLLFYFKISMLGSWAMSSNRTTVWNKAATAL